jgi:hypothetical protein
MRGRDRLLQPPFELDSGRRVEVALVEAGARVVGSDGRQVGCHGFAPSLPNRRGQYLLQSFNTAASPNLQGGRLPEGIGANSVIAKSDGTTTNTNLFRLRRTRLRTFYETDLLRVFMQLDLLPAGGPSAAQGTIARNAEVVGKIHWSKKVRTEVKGGLFATRSRCRRSRQGRFF